MKTFIVQILYNDGKEEYTRVCGKNYYEAADVARDWIFDSKRKVEEVTSISFDQIYDIDDHNEYGDDYEW